MSKFQTDWFMRFN